MKKTCYALEFLAFTEDDFIEGETIKLEYYENKIAREKPKHITRKVRYDKEAGDLYIIYKNKKYFYFEFK